MHVLFVEPAFPKNQREFPRALAAVGARVTAIGEAPPEALGSVRQYLHAYEQVSSVTNEQALEDAVRRVQAREWVDRLESTVEAHTMPVAHVRERTEIPGTSTKTAYLCRDKPAMKQVLREADVPCAMSTGATSADEARDFAKEQGYPLILKPRDAAGASGTYRVDNDEELEQAIVACRLDRGMPTAIEEFIEGHEGFYDTLTVGGRVVHEFICHYYPNVLEAMRTRWISPQIVVTNRNDGGLHLRRGARRSVQARDRRPSRHRDERDAHGVVLRPEGAEVLRDRLPAARRQRLGPLRGGATTSTSTSSGPRRSAAARTSRPRRASTPAA